jgi:uncharacterized membrane protein
LADDSKTFAFLATFLSIIGFVIALVTKKDDKYVMYYAKQSLVLFIAYVIIWIALFIIGLVTLGFGFILYPIAWILLTILWIVSWVYALSGEMKPLPVIGKFADNFKF